MTLQTKIAVAFIKAQTEMGNATKDSSNPFFKTKYADLNSIREACLPALNKNGIGVLQPIVQIEGKNFVKTILLHESGETIESFTEILFAKQNDPQAQGSGITYARRYGLQSLVSIGAEDDNGDKASEQLQTIKTINIEQGLEIEKLLRLVLISKDVFCKVYNIHSINQLPISKFNEAKTKLENKAKIENANN